MLKLLETFKDSAESTVDSAMVRLENCHRLVDGYVWGRIPRGSRLPATSRRDRPRAIVSIYDLLRGVNREVGEFGTDVFQIIDDARARHQSEKTR